MTPELLAEVQKLATTADAAARAVEDCESKTQKDFQTAAELREWIMKHGDPKKPTLVRLPDGRYLFFRIGERPDDGSPHAFYWIVELDGRKVKP